MYQLIILVTHFFKMLVLVTNEGGLCFQYYVVLELNVFALKIPRETTR